MLIGEIVQQTGVSRDTIRYYERLGLLQSGGRPSRANNYKAYPATTITRLAMIQRAKNLGFSLTEIADGFSMLDNEQLSDEVVQARAAEKLAVIDEKIQALEAMRSTLLYSLEQFRNGRCVIQRYRAGRAKPPGPEALAEQANSTAAPHPARR